ncbi:MAG: hypothetical protein ICV62_01415 [Cyanobacteria bacterium Co-bin13]|nr:hypothetical protein [Cyanobacteria bacterium Co-bin13]
MTLSPLVKTSPLAGVYRRYPVKTELLAGWCLAQHFGHPEREQQQLLTGAVLVDWACLGKVSVSGRGAAEFLDQIVPGVAAVPPLASQRVGSLVALRLTVNDYLMLCLPDQTDSLVTHLEASSLTVIDQSGALGCFALAGSRRDEVLERSTALNLRRDSVLAGAVLQTTLHNIRCTLYRTADLEVILHSRNLSESLFDALMDVGIGVGLLPSGTLTLPITLLSS